MELKIIDKKEEPLLSRTRVEVEITFEKATPSKEEIKSRLVKDLGKDEKLIVVKGIYTYLGSKKAKNLSYVYENEESLKSIEPRVKNKAGKKKEEPEEGNAEEKPQSQAKKPEAKEDQKKEAKQEQKTEQKEAKQEEQKPQEKKSQEQKKSTKGKQ